MGKYRPFILLGVAIIIALITSVLIYNYLQKKEKVIEVKLETQDIAVAKTDLPWGKMIDKEAIKMEPFLKKSLPGGYFSDPSSLIGRVIISPLKANEPILDSRLAPTTVKTGGVAAMVNPKKRAISVKVDKVIGVAGYIYAGNRVDVLVTIAHGKTPEPITKTVLENILVLAVGPAIEPKGKEATQTLVDVITLEVTPEEAEKIALAATEGKLLLALRNFSDTEDIFTKGVTIPTLLASYSSPAAPATKPVVRKAVVGKKPAPEKLTKPIEEKKVEKVEIAKPIPIKPPVFIVELIKGVKVSEVKFEGGE